MARHADLIDRLQNLRAEAHTLADLVGQAAGPGIPSAQFDHFCVWSRALTDLLIKTPPTPPTISPCITTTYG